MQDLIVASGWPTLATVSSASWLTASMHGRGIATWMRRAVLTLAFRSLGATRAETTGYAANAPSRRVSEKIGYREVGTSVELVEECERLLVHYRLEASRFEDDPSVTIAGLTPDVIARLKPSLAS